MGAIVSLTDIHGETAEAVSRLLGVPGYDFDGGHTVHRSQEDDRLWISATTTQAFAKLSIVHRPQQFIAFTSIDFEGGTQMSRVLHGNRLLQIYEQDWNPDKGTHGAPRAIVPAYPAKTALDLQHLSQRVMAMTKPAITP